LATVNHAYGDMSAIARVPSGTAHIMAMGDSISNDNNTNFVTWSQGAVRYARPQRWDAVHSMVSQSGVQGRYTIIETSQTNTRFSNVAPGALVGNVDFRGVSPHLYSEAKTNANATENAYYNAFAWKAMFVDQTIAKHEGEEIFVNADGSLAIELGDNVVYTSLVLSRTDGVGDYIDDIRIKQVTGGIGGSNFVDRSLSATDNRSGVHIYAVDSGTDAVDSTYFSQSYVAASVDHAGSNWGSTPLQFGTVGAIANINDRDGFRWVYAGNGGWQTSNHLDDYPDGDQVNGGLNGRSYTDEGLADYIKCTETNTFFIYLGANDSWLSPGSGENVANNLEGIVQRLKTACLSNGINDDKYIVIGPSVIDRGATADGARSQKKIMAEQLQLWALATQDVCFLDLQEYLETRFDFTNLPDASPSGNPWCEFGTMGTESTNPLPDYVHPNWDGMDLMWNDFFWPAALAAEAGGTSDYPATIIDVPILTYTKVEDTDPDLTLTVGNGWWTNNNSSYTFDPIDLEFNESPRDNLADNPRIRGGNLSRGNMILDMYFLTTTYRQNFLTTVPDDAFLRMTVESDGDTWIGESRPISQLLTDNTAGAPDFAANGTQLLQWCIDPAEWVAGPSVPTINSNGFGSAQGWDTEMGITIEILRQEETQGDGTYQYLYQMPGEVRRAASVEEYFRRISPAQRRRYARGARLNYEVDPIVVSTASEYRRLLTVVKTFENK